MSLRHDFQPAKHIVQISEQYCVYVRVCVWILCLYHCKFLEFQSFPRCKRSFLPYINMYKKKLFACLTVFFPCQMEYATIFILKYQTRINWCVGCCFVVVVVLILLHMRIFEYVLIWYPESFIL